MRKFFLIFIISSVSMFAQSAGNSGLAFLKMGFGARNIAMGDAGTVAANDVTALFYNPARLSGQEGSEVFLMHNAWIQGVTSDVLGVRSTVWGLPVALGFNVTSINDIQVRTIASAQPIATFNANYFFGSISTGFNIYDNLSAGITARYLYEGLYTDEAAGWGFDFGLNYPTPVDGLTASAVIKDIGSMSKLKNEKTKLPTEIAIGPAYNFNLVNNKFSVTAAAEFQKYTATNDTHFNFGLEILYDHLIALRGGYQSGYEAKNFTGGFGIIWGNFGIDYAFQPFSQGLGDANMFSIRFKF